jgi:ABC-type lipoprotein release transport system permease subunit
VLVAWSSYGAFVLRAWPWGAVAGSLAVTLGIGTLISIGAAIGPAYAAARKQPIEALRVEE